MYIYLDICENFSCQMCGTCCRNAWQVTVDKDSYRRNAALFNSSGRQAEFEQAFIRLTAGGGLGEYAYIAKQAGGGCWFLDKSNLCLLHKEAGHEQLDAVCRIFPRYPISTARGIELTLSFSCPAVLKLADRKQPLTVVRAEQSPYHLVAGHYAAHIYPDQQPVKKPLHYYFELEAHFIDLLQCRALTLSDRLAVVADTARAVSALSGDAAIGRQLTALFNRNYDWLAGLAEVAAAGQLATTGTGINLLENFFVNFVFKKPFYLYGFEKTLQLLTYMHRQLMNADDIARAIMALEFQYGHDRQALLNNTNEITT